MRALGRLILVPVAGLIAAAVALLVAGTLGLERMAQALARADDDTMLSAVFTVLRGGVDLSAGLTLVPALLVIIVGEVAKLRSVLYYVLGGGAALVLAPLLTTYSRPLDGGAASAGLWQVLATAGFAGGLVYWLIAGRRA